MLEGEEAVGQASGRLDDEVHCFGASIAEARRNDPMALAAIALPCAGISA